MMGSEAGLIVMSGRPTNSASNLHQRKLCPGSAWAEYGLVEPESEDAAEGVMLHWRDAHPEADRGDLTDEQRRTLERNAQLREAFLRCVRFECDIADEDPREEYIEQTFQLYDGAGAPWVHPVFDEPFTGHPDRVLYYPKQRIAVIFDSKFGRNPVPHASLNMQLRAYAVMVWQKKPCVRVFVAITQPWCSAPEDFHSAGYEGTDLQNSCQEILSTLGATIPLKAPRHPSPEACGYCLAKANCKPALAVVRHVAVLKVQNLPPADLEAMAPGVKLAKEVCAAWDERMKEIARTDPDALSHFMLGKESFTTTVGNPREAFRKLYAAGWLGSDQKAAFDQFIGCLSVGLGKLRQLVSEANKVSADDAEKIIDNALEEIISRKPRERSLVKKK